MKIEARISNLESALAELKKELILQKIDLRAEGERPWDGKSKRIKNFITWEARPSEIHKFKTKLPARLRAKVILASPVIQFDPRKLKTAQKNVIAKNLKYFVQNQNLAASAIEHEHYGAIHSIVARVRRGYFLYDGNHRACTNLLAGRTHPAICIDLRNIDALITRLKKEDNG